MERGRSAPCLRLVSACESGIMVLEAGRHAYASVSWHTAQMLGASMFFVIACGNCLYYAMWHRFPPIASCGVILPIWLVALAGVRAFSGAHLTAVPPIHAAIPLVLVVWIFAPGTGGPLLYLWIPFCCVIGTISGLRAAQTVTVRRTVAKLSFLAVLSLISFGALNSVSYNRMPPEERARYLPGTYSERGLPDTYSERGRQSSRPIDVPFIANSIGMKLALIPAGECPMGSPDSDEHVEDHEKPQHQVQITKPFHLGIYEVTQQEWTAVMGTTPWKGKYRVKEGDHYPATHVSWEDATRFCRKLTEKERAAGRLKPGESYRLPTEAEWEYASRAASTTRYHFGNAEASLGEYAWYEGNAYTVGEEHARAVGFKRANAWGLCDMYGNVLEWCADRYGAKYYGETPSIDPQGPSEGSRRVNRGGSWDRIASYCRSAIRHSSDPAARDFDLGFRVARTIAPGK